MKRYNLMYLPRHINMKKRTYNVSTAAHYLRLNILVDSARFDNEQN